MTKTKQDDEQLELITKIVERASDLGILAFDRVSLHMDLDVAMKEFNLRLEELLNADNFNFSHDIVGIQLNIDRRNFKMNDVFVPRFAEV